MLSPFARFVPRSTCNYHSLAFSPFTSSPSSIPPVRSPVLSVRRRHRRYPPRPLSVISDAARAWCTRLKSLSLSRSGHRAEKGRESVSCRHGGKFGEQCASLGRLSGFPKDRTGNFVLREFPLKIERSRLDLNSHEPAEIPRKPPTAENERKREREGGKERVG